MQKQINRTFFSYFELENNEHEINNIARTTVNWYQKTKLCFDSLIE